MKEENVILVNQNDEQIGLMPKLEAHEKAVLHRAFSVFVLNDKNEIMLQQRANQKYHSPLLWTNTCCSHQREGETNIQAGSRRLFEEMGFKTGLKELFHFIYVWIMLEYRLQVANLCPISVGKSNFLSAASQIFFPFMSVYFGGIILFGFR